MTKSQLLNQIQAMEGHDVKALVLEWLMGTDGRLEDLTEAAMAAQSLQVLEEYKRDRDGVSHEIVREWLDSIGTEKPLPCPK